jgi:hypothetical protein
MGTAHAARIYWSVEQVERGLPAVTRTIEPAWFLEAGQGSEQGWTLVCEFDSPPSVQGNPSTAQVAFWVEGAPHERLAPGVALRLFERATRQHARVEILG